eukprot:COSAG05_NODE_1084_length_5930_cov_11.147316_7_plen_65_part_00
MPKSHVLVHARGLKHVTWAAALQLSPLSAALSAEARLYIGVQVQRFFVSVLAQQSSAKSVHVWR